MFCTRMNTLAFLLLELFPLLVFEFDFLCALLLEYPSQYFDDQTQAEVTPKVRKPELSFL